MSNIMWSRLSFSLRSSSFRSLLPSSRVQEQPENATMLWHKMFEFLMNILVVFLQLMFGSKAVSPFETHHRTMFMAVVALHIYIVALAAEIKLLLHYPTSNYTELMGNTRFLSGILASILLLKIIFPTIGWFCFIIWMWYLVKIVYRWLSSEQNVLPL